MWLQFLVFVLDVIRVLVVFGLLAIFCLILAFSVLWLLVKTLQYQRKLAYERRQRKIKKSIEKTYTDFMERQKEPKLYVASDIGTSLDDIYRQHQQDQETIDKATEYRNGISD